MKEHLSTFYSDDGSRTALIYKTDLGYAVIAINTPLGLEKTVTFNDLLSSENYAEDWVI